MDHRRVEDHTAVVDGHQSQHPDGAELRVDLGDRRVGAERERHPRLEAVVDPQRPGGPHQRREVHRRGAVLGAVHGAVGPPHRLRRQVPQFRGPVPGLVGQQCRQVLQQRAGDLRRPAGERADPVGLLAGVALDQQDPGHVDAEGRGDQRGKHRLVALAAGGGTAPGGDRAVLVGLEAAELVQPAGFTAGALHVARQPDAQRQGVGVGAAPGLLRAPRVVAEGLQRQVERGGVVAAVVPAAGRRLVREPVRRDEVAPAQLRRVEAEAIGEGVDRPFQGHGRLGPAGPRYG
ncbi:hypothetical protein GCM10027610_051040 [Dactylosporangium cerinum]